MTPQKRLDQIEPVVGEILAVLDQHTALHRQTQAQIKQLTVTFTQAFAQQSDQISFLLTDAAERKEQTTHIQHQVDFLLTDAVERKEQTTHIQHQVDFLSVDAKAKDQRLERLETDVSTLKSDVSTLKSDVSTLKADVGEILSILRQR